MQYSKTQKVHVVEIIDQLTKNLKHLETKPHAMDLAIDIDTDGNVSATQTGITLRIVFPCTLL